MKFMRRIFYGKINMVLGKYVNDQCCLLPKLVFIFPEYTRPRFGIVRGIKA